MKGRDDVERRKKGGSADASSPGWGSMVCEWNVYTETIPQEREKSQQLVTLFSLFSVTQYSHSF